MLFFGFNFINAAIAESVIPISGSSFTPISQPESAVLQTENTLIRVFEAHQSDTVRTPYNSIEQSQGIYLILKIVVQNETNRTLDLL